MINGEREIEVASGGTLLTTLGAKKYFYHQLVVVVEHVFNVNVTYYLVEEKHYQQKHLTLQEKN